MLDRAYARLEVRALDDDAREFEGWATTPATDRMGDTIDPKGARFSNPLPLLHQHDSDRPIGTVKLKRATKEGIAFVARIPKITEPGPLKDRVDTAWGEIKAGLVRAVSIGFRILKDGVQVAEDGLRFTAIEIVELSAVSVPANAEATITNIRALDLGAAASGNRPDPQPRPASRDLTQPLTRKGAAMPRTHSEVIDDLNRQIATKASRMSALWDGSGDRGETMDPGEVEEFDTLAAEVDVLKAQLARAKVLESAQAAAAVSVQRTIVTPVREVGRIEPVVRTIDRTPPGIRMARVVRCLMLAKMTGGDEEKALKIAQRDYSGDGEVVEFIRAAVAAGTTTDPTWAGALVGPAGSIVADFVEFLRPQTILGQFGQGNVPSLRNVPFRAALIGQTSGGMGYWVGEGKAKPLTKFDFARKQLDPLKVATIAVLTKEVIRDSSPAAEGLVRDGLIEALRERLDLDFVDPAKAAVANVSPASITNGVVPIPSSGNDADAVRADVKAAFAAYTAGNNSLSGGVWIAPSNLAASLGFMTNLLGQQEFPGVDRNGGTLAGFPIIASDYVPDETVILANARDIYLGDEGGFAVDISGEASLEMLDNPIGDSGTPTGAATMVSMFQTNSVAILAERTINWMKRRPEAVVMLSDVQWGDAPGP